MNNPFDHEHVDAWSNDVADVASLNAPVSDEVVASIEAVRQEARKGAPDLRSVCLLIVGPAGTGKTHLFARLRHRLGPRAAFILLRPEIGTEPTPRLILAATIDALKRNPPGHQETQLDILVGNVLARLAARGEHFPTTHLADLREASPTRRQELISTAVESIAQKYPEIDEGWLERLLMVPTVDAAQRRASLAWLSGREPDAMQLERLGLKEPLPDSSVLPALKTLAIIAAQSTPLVLMFDQLENLVQDEETRARVAAYATLVAELFDSVRGLVILQMALDAEWRLRIAPVLSLAQSTRLAGRRLELALPTEHQRRELLDAWTRALPVSERRPAPWPLSAKEWLTWGTGPGVTPRSLMVACREALSRAVSGAELSQEDPAESLDARLDELWDEELTKARAMARLASEEARGVDAAGILGGLLGALHLLKFKTATPRASAKAHDLQVGAPDGPCDVFLVQHANHRSVGAALKRAALAAASRRVVVMREASRPFPSSWHRCHEELRAVRASVRARWIELAPRELHDLLALAGLLASARSQDLSGRDGKPIAEAAVHEWATRVLKPEGWRVIASITGHSSSSADDSNSADSTGGAPSGVPSTSASAPSTESSASTAGSAVAQRASSTAVPSTPANAALQLALSTGGAPSGGPSTSASAASQRALSGAASGAQSTSKGPESQRAASTGGVSSVRPSTSGGAARLAPSTSGADSGLRSTSGTAAAHGATSTAGSAAQRAPSTGGPTSRVPSASDDAADRLAPSPSGVPSSSGSAAPQRAPSIGAVAGLPSISGSAAAQRAPSTGGTAPAQRSLFSESTVITPPLAPPVRPAGAHSEAGTVAALLLKLRLASVDRLVREARAQSTELTRAQVLAELHELGPRVRWFGRAIAWWHEESR